MRTGLIVLASWRSTFEGRGFRPSFRYGHVPHSNRENHGRFMRVLVSRPGAQSSGKDRSTNRSSCRATVLRRTEQRDRGSFTSFGNYRDPQLEFCKSLAATRAWGNGGDAACRNLGESPQQRTQGQEGREKPYDSYAPGKSELVLRRVLLYPGLPNALV